MGHFVKDPNNNWDYTWNFSEFLENESDAIASVSVIAPSGISLGTVTFTSQSVTAWLSGGTLHETYIVTCRITTDDTRVVDKMIMVLIEET